MVAAVWRKSSFQGESLAEWRMKSGRLPTIEHESEALSASESLLETLTPRATILSPDRRRVVTFDREGRWVYYFRDGLTFKRSLASEVHLRFRKSGRQRRRLDESEAREVSSEVFDMAGALSLVCRGEARRRLESEVLAWSPDRLVAEGTRFADAYRPITILPPDQYLSIVLQATEGCSWNRCTFCNFYMDRPFRVRCPEDFAEHVRRVEELLGKGLAMRRGIFLADGNALALSNQTLDPLLDLANRTFPDREFFGFVDLYSGDRRTVDEWSHLARKGLKRVYVGMETGLDELLEWVNKPGSADELRHFVSTLKQSGLQVSLIVMVGLGGREHRRSHAEATRDLLFELSLNQDDLVYLSPFVEHPNSTYRQRRQASGGSAMTESEVETEVARMAEELRLGGLRVSRYDIREFIY